jgi:hypothetical protein
VGDSGRPAISSGVVRRWVTGGTGGMESKESAEPEGSAEELEAG